MSAVKFIMLNVKAYWRRRADDPEADRRPGEDAFSRLFCNATAAFWEKLGPPIADNYNVRWGVRDHVATPLCPWIAYRLVYAAGTGHGAKLVTRRAGALQCLIGQGTCRCCIFVYWLCQPALPSCR